MATVGNCKYTYQLVENWAELPRREEFGACMDVATDSQDRVYVFQRTDPPVLVFDRDGTYLRSWGLGAITDSHGLNIHDDIVYLTDREDSVALKFTLEGKPLQVLGQRGVHSDTGCEKIMDMVPRAAGPFNYLTKIVPSSSGDLYVSDGYRNARVHRFSADGLLISSWGEPGKTEPNQFHVPHSILVHDQKVYVCDRENNRIQIFSLDGKYITMWTDTQRPSDIWVDKDGIFYIAELPWSDTRPYVSVLDGDGKVLARWECRVAHGITVDSHGDIYVALTGDQPRISPGKQVDKYVRQR